MPELLGVNGGAVARLSIATIEVWVKHRECQRRAPVAPRGGVGSVGERSAQLRKATPVYAEVRVRTRNLTNADMPGARSIPCRCRAAWTRYSRSTLHGTTPSGAGSSARPEPQATAHPRRGADQATARDPMIGSAPRATIVAGTADLRLALANLRWFGARRLIARRPAVGSAIHCWHALRGCPTEQMSQMGEAERQRGSR